MYNRTFNKINDENIPYHSYFRSHQHKILGNINMFEESLYEVWNNQNQKDVRKIHLC